MSASGTSARPRWQRALVPILLVPIAALGLWSVAAHLHREEIPPAPFEEARDLPPLPAPADNGWTVLTRAPEGAFDDDPPTLDLLRGSDGPPDLRALAALHDQLAAWSPPDEARAAIDAALARPRFAIACPLELEVQCPTLELLRAHRIAAALALRDAQAGWHQEALERAERLLRLDRDALETSRTIIAAMVSAAAAREAIELTALLGAEIGAQDADAITDGVAAQLDATELALVSLEPQRWSLEPALIGEAILLRRGLAVVAADDASWAMDRGRIARAFDDYFASAIAYARDVAHAPPPERPTPDATWRFFDPLGTAALDALAIELALHVERFEDEAFAAED
nr:hypothetical protein [Myxococcota bacterium]